MNKVPVSIDELVVGEIYHDQSGPNFVELEFVRKEEGYVFFKPVNEAKYNGPYLFEDDGTIGFMDICSPWYKVVENS